MAESQPTVPAIGELLAGAPQNWGRWGPDDEVGCLNYLDASEVLRGIRHVRSGEVFTLQVHMGHPKGDPVWPGRRGPEHLMLVDEGMWAGDKGPQLPGGLHFADDIMTVFLQGSTQYDALGHAWYDGQLWNGYDASTTIGGLSKASVLPIAERGVVGRGVLIDIARHRKTPHLGKGETFDHTDLLEAANAQGVEIEPHDILVIRTGFVPWWYETTPAEFYDDFVEPGLTYSPELVAWLAETEIPNIVADTLAVEVTYDPKTGVAFPLHCALMRNLGIALTEIAWLEDLAEACAADGRYTFLYAAAPLKVVRGSAAPVNPIAIR